MSTFYSYVEEYVSGEYHMYHVITSTRILLK